MPEALWEKTLAINLHGTVHCCRAFLGLLLQARAGRVVNVSSCNGLWATLPGSTPITAYATSKFAVRGFSEALADDMHRHHPTVTVACVYPGHIGTDIAFTKLKFGTTAWSAEELAQNWAKVKQLRKAVKQTRVDDTDRDVDTMEQPAIMKELADNFKSKAPLTVREL